MNTTAQDIKNLFYFSKLQTYQTDIFKLCLEYLKNGKLVAYFTRLTEDFLPLLREVGISKDELLKIIIMYADDIEGITKKIMGMHEWHLLPDLIVLDLNSFLRDFVTKEPALLPDEDMESSKPLLQQLCLCIASLFAYVNTVHSNRLANGQNGKAEDASTPISTQSLVLLHEFEDQLTKRELDLLISLYFYKNQAFHDLEELKMEMITSGR